MTLPNNILTRIADRDKNSGELRLGRLIKAHVTACGRIRVEYRWGTRSFDNQTELELWLAGIVPASWQQ